MTKLEEVKNEIKELKKCRKLLIMLNNEEVNSKAMQKQDKPKVKKIEFKRNKYMNSIN